MTLRYEYLEKLPSVVKNPETPESKEFLRCLTPYDVVQLMFWHVTEKQKKFSQDELVPFIMFVLPFYSACSKGESFQFLGENKKFEPFFETYSDMYSG